MTYYANIACELPRDPKMIAAGWQARAVYVEGLLFARENLTDGRLLRVQLPFWMCDMSAKSRIRHLDRLAEIGALKATDDGWEYPAHVWKKWNPTRADVEAKREDERKRKAAYREKKRREREAKSR